MKRGVNLNLFYSNKAITIDHRRNTMNIGKRIRYLREKNDFTQKDLAQLLHVSEKTIGNYESGKRHPSIDMVTNLSKVLHVSIVDFFNAELSDYEIEGIIYAKSISKKIAEDKTHLPFYNILIASNDTFLSPAFERMFHTTYNCTIVQSELFSDYDAFPNEAFDYILLYFINEKEKDVVYLQQLFNLYPSSHIIALVGREGNVILDNYFSAYNYSVIRLPNYMVNVLKNVKKIIP